MIYLFCYLKTIAISKGVENRNINNFEIAILIIIKSNLFVTFLNQNF